MGCKCKPGTKGKNCEMKCPARCKTCKAGASWDGGLRLNSDNVCEHFCSRWGYCGDGPEFRFNGAYTDCTGCVQGNKRPKRVFIGRYKCDDDHWTRGHLYGGVEACQARCKGYRYMIHVPMGACACQNTCKEVVTNCAGPVKG